jgi:hypothetical protein
LALANRDLRVTGPRADESALIHDLFLRSKQLLSPNTAFGFQSVPWHFASMLACFQQKLKFLGV